MRPSLLPIALAALVPQAAHAQAVDDWDIDRDARARQVTASVIYSDGSGIATRCTAGSFEVLLAGLPPPPDDGDFVRTLTIGLGDDEAYPQTWLRGESPGVAFSLLPARIARALREGGRLRIASPGSEGSEPSVIAIDIPPSPAAINETLSACDRPIEDPRDEGRSWLVSQSPSPLSWSRPPRPDYPDRAISGGLVRGIAAVSCRATVEGRLEDCEVEMEHPSGFDLGREALLATRGGRLASGDGSPIEPTIITFRVHYEMEP